MLSINFDDVPIETGFTRKEVKAWEKLLVKDKDESSLEVGFIGCNEYFIVNPHDKYSDTIDYVIGALDKHASFYISPDLTFVHIMFDLDKVRSNKKADTATVLLCMESMDRASMRYNCELRLLDDETKVPFDSVILGDAITDKETMTRFFNGKPKKRAPDFLKPFKALERKYSKYGIIRIDADDEKSRSVILTQIQIWQTHKGTGSLILSHICDLLDELHMGCILEVDQHCDKGNVLASFYMRFGFIPGRDNEMIRIPR